MGIPYGWNGLRGEDQFGGTRTLVGSGVVEGGHLRQGRVIVMLQWDIQARGELNVSEVREA